MVLLPQDCNATFEDEIVLMLTITASQNTISNIYSVVIELMLQSFMTAKPGCTSFC
jgi:hypothetical protein